MRIGFIIADDYNNELKIKGTLAILSCDDEAHTIVLGTLNEGARYALEAAVLLGVHYDIMPATMKWLTQSIGLIHDEPVVRNCDKIIVFTEGAPVKIQAAINLAVTLGREIEILE